MSNYIPITDVNSRNIKEATIKEFQSIQNKIK